MKNYPNIFQRCGRDRFGWLVLRRCL